MKQNNTNMLFKSLALCFLILGNLTFDVLCKVPLPTSSITPTVPAKIVEEKDVAVPTSNVCTVINKHYKMKSTEDFFSTLVNPAGATEYKFPFNSKDDGKVILENKIKAAGKATAKDAFDAFKAEVEKINDDVNKIKTSTAVNTTVLQTFMSNFKFERDKFVVKNTVTFAGSALPLNWIADNLVVYLNCSLEDLINEIANLHVNADMDDILMKTLTDAEVNLAAAAANVTTAAEKVKTAAADYEKAKADFDAAFAVSVPDIDAARDAADKASDAVIVANTAKTDAEKVKTDAQQKLNEAIDKAISEAKRQASDAVNAAVKKLIVDKLTTAPAPTSKPTSLKDLSKELSSFHIKTEYKNSASTTSSVAAVTYLIVCTAIPGDTIPLDIEIINFGNDKIFVPQFIDTKNVLAKDVFVAISEKSAATGVTDAINAIDHFKAILAKFSSADFATTVGNVLSTVVPEKKVLQKEFNDVFDSFNTLVPVGVQDGDIKAIDDLVTVENGNCKVKLHYLSNDEKPFDNYIAWLENNNHLQSKEFNDKPAAVTEFFKVLQDNLAAYKTKLEKDLKSAEVKLEEKPDDKKHDDKKHDDKKHDDKKHDDKKHDDKKPDDKKHDDKKPDDKETKEKLIVKQQQKSKTPTKPETRTRSKTKTIFIIVGSVGGFLILVSTGLFTYWKFYPAEKV